MSKAPTRLCNTEESDALSLCEKRSVETAIHQSPLDLVQTEIDQKFYQAICLQQPTEWRPFWVVQMVRKDLILRDDTVNKEYTWTRNNPRKSVRIHIHKFSFSYHFLLDSFLFLFPEELICCCLFLFVSVTMWLFWRRFFTQEGQQMLTSGFKCFPR